MSLAIKSNTGTQFSFFLSALFYIVVTFVFPAPAVFAEEFGLPQISGTIEGEGTRFEITDSAYLNIGLDSAEPIKIRMESVPEMVTMMIEPVSPAISTQITLRGFLPQTTYYKYEDDYHNLIPFITDNNGVYSYIQDISKPHVIFIQPRKSTKFIRDDATGGDCSLIGTWNIATKTCTLTQDVFETIQIDSNNIILDGNGHTITGSNTGNGVYLFERMGVTIRNLTIENFPVGILLHLSSGGILTNNTTSNNGSYGILFIYSDNNALTDNTASNNGGYGIFLFSSSGNTLTGTIAQENFAYDMYVEAPSDSDCNNVIANTTGSDGRPIKYFSSAVNLNNETLSELILCNADNSNISNITIDGSATKKNNGLFLMRTDSSTIANVNSPDNFIGIFLYSSGTNTLTGSIVSDNYADGILLFDSSNNALTGNTMSNNSNYGISIGFSNNNQIYNTNFINNLLRIEIPVNGNLFNLPLPNGGNYWSNFDEPLEGCNDINNDKICDAPYVFSGGQDNYPWKVQNGWTLPPELPTCCSNVAFLPGHQGSRLYREGVLFEDRLWEPNIINVSDFSALALSPTTAESVNNDIYTKDIIDESYTELQGFNVYKKFIDFMNEKTDEGLIEEWKALPYDWRLDFNQLLSSGKVIGGTEENPLISYTETTSSPYIFQELERLADSSQNGKVTLITHSNGGLLAKYLLNEISNPSHPYHHLYTKIDKVIMVAAPQTGTPKAIEGLLHGDSTQLGAKEWGIIIDEAQSRELAENMQSAYNLLPSKKYFDTVQSPVIEFDPDVASIYDFPSLYGTEITAPEALDKFLLGDNGLRTEPSQNDEEAPNVLKTLFLNRASATHDVLDSWVPPSHIEVIQIAGWGIKTIKGIRYDDCDIIFCPDTLSNLDRKILKTQQGDGTVVLPSAIAMDGETNVETYYVNVRDHNEEILTGLRRNRDHANILEIESLQDFIKNIILNERTLTDDIYAVKPTPKLSDTSIDFSLHSPVALHLYDSNGKHTGTIPNPLSSARLYEATIPNSYYEEIGEVKYGGVSGATTTTVVLVGEDLGTFTLNIEETLGDQTIAQTAFINIPVTASTTATLSLASVDTMTTLSMDIDGNGTTDATVTAGEESDVPTSLEILVNILDTMNIHKGLKNDLVKKIGKALKELEKDRTEKAMKELDKMIKKLEKEIEKNLKKSYHDEKDNDQDDKDENNGKQKISTKDAEKLIQILRQIKESIV